MSSFVLNRNYELALPTSYVDVDNEEMEYVDGGKVIYTISTSKCNQLAAALAIATGILTCFGAVATLVATIVGTPFAGAVTACIATCIVGMAGAASGYFWLASARNGMNVHSDGFLSIKW